MISLIERSVVHQVTSNFFTVPAGTKDRASVLLECPAGDGSPC